MNKQIEEMAEAIFQNCQCGLFFSEAEKIADFVINKQGYRKSTDVAREIFAELETVLCYKVHPVVDRDGFIHTIRTNDMRIRLEDFHAIKKKYESEECVE